MPLIETISSQDIDVIGDIHGEIDALNNLLERLGYDIHSDVHPQGRRLIFVGDLIDRGPNSIAVVRKVRDLINAGTAQAIIGNHELELETCAHLAPLIGIGNLRIGIYRNCVDKRATRNCIYGSVIIIHSSSRNLVATVVCNSQ